MAGIKNWSSAKVLGQKQAWASLHSQEPIWLENKETRGSRGNRGGKTLLKAMDVHGLCCSLKPCLCVGCAAYQGLQSHLSFKVMSSSIRAASKELFWAHGPTAASRTVLMSVSHATTKGHVDVHSLCCSLTHVDVCVLDYHLRPC